MATKGWAVSLLVCVTLGAAGSLHAGPASQAAAAGPVQPVLAEYCVTCHNQRIRTAGLALDALDLANVSADAEVWEKVIEKLRAGVMPPAGRPRPDQATYQAVVAWLESTIDTAAASAPNPGRMAAFRRLNRFEYHAAVRDLLDLDVEISELLPMDSTSDEGFDNNVSQLSVTPALLDRYLSAAGKISRLAVGIVPSTALVDTYRVHKNLIQNERVSDDLPYGSQGGVAVRHYFPADGEYQVRIILQRHYNDFLRGMGRAHTLDVRLNGRLVKRFSIGGEAPGRMAPSGYAGNILMSREWREYMMYGDKDLVATFPAKAGPQVLGLSFHNEWTAPENVPQPRAAGFALANNEFPYGPASVDSLELTGPLDVAGPGETPSRARVFVCRPRSSDEEPACARTILSTLARRAFRRPTTDADLERLLTAYQNGRKKGDFDLGIQYALQQLLVDPGFLFRVEREPVKAAGGGGVSPVSDLELASRLSFFLWGSLPDEALLELGVRGALSEPKVFEAQVRRMLADPRATKSLVDGFAAQWLQLRALADAFRSPEIYPEFDENLRTSFAQETKLFIASTLREDRSVLDLLRANYTYLNERLARHYGIPNVYGEQFRRVELSPTDPRGGLLTQGSILTVTSYPNRTSPVLRGKWLMQNILGVSPPAPPANVPPLPEQGTAGVPVSVRARLEQHRQNPVCATCHAPMDPLGFALENFDANGAWRTVEQSTAPTQGGVGGARLTMEGAVPLDVSAVLPNGTEFEGPAGLRATLASQPEQFATTVTERLLAFALGRSLNYYDRPTVRQIVQGAAEDQYRWSSIILGIVESTPFRMRKVVEPATQTASATDR